MLTFAPCTPENLKRAAPLIRRADFLCNDWSVGALIMWGERFQAQYCVRNDTMVIREEINGQPAFSWPVGPDRDGMLDELIAYTEANGLALRFFGLDGEMLKALRTDPRFPGVMAAHDEKWSDYLYDRGEMAAFSGRRFSGQRNHINKYRSLYGEPALRFMTPEDEGAVLDMLAQYEREHPDRSAVEEEELRQTRVLLRHYADFGLPAACLALNGGIAAFTIGEIVGGTLFIHVEKALKSVKGAYPTLFHGFVNLVGDRTPPLRFVNREDDSGDPGLRTSKRQYHPVFLLPKYQARVRAPGAGLDAYPVLREGPVALTALRPEDRPAYLLLSTDVDNNRWWGYDYRQDDGIVLPVDENTFYDMALFDMAAGDSINFAVRERPDGPLIGEAILWNFDARGAEAGVRLFPAFQGRGLGGSAITAAARFGEDALGLPVRARCFRENLPSRHMLARCGFRSCGEDETYLYFRRAQAARA